MVAGSNPAGTNPTDYLYTSQRQEAGLGLYFYNARWYDPYLNQFSQPDTIIPNPSNPQDYNRYGYALNNPIRYNDPTGHCIDAGDAPPSQHHNICPPTLSQMGYNILERQTLVKLYSEGGKEAQHGVKYIIDNKIHIRVSQGISISSTNDHRHGLIIKDWQNIGDIAGWYERDTNTIVLKSNYADPSYSGYYTWGLATVIHEAKHLEQGAPLTKSKELEAGQISITVNSELNGGVYPTGGRDFETLQLNINDPTSIYNYNGILFHYSFGYWIGYSMLENGTQPPNP